MLQRLFGFIFFTIIVFIPFTNQLSGEERSFLEKSLLLSRADSLYSHQKYNRALDTYRHANQIYSAPFSPAARFKMAYAAYRIGQYAFASKEFRKLVKTDHFLSEFSVYFYFRSLWHSNKDSAQSVGKNILTDLPAPLQDSVCVFLGNYYFSEKQYQQAIQYYGKLNLYRLKPPLDVSIRIRMSRAYTLLGKADKAQRISYQIIKKYAERREVLLFADSLREARPSWFKDHFFDFVDVYFKNKKYSKAERFLSWYIQQPIKAEQKERARFNLIRLYYERHYFRTALYGFQKLLNHLQSKKLEPYIRLYLARAYRRLGAKQKAIDSYLDYAKRFPRRRLAPEVVWKSAWLYEEMARLPQAARLYHQVYDRWPHSRYAKEALFREGFTYYRLGDKQTARRIFMTIRLKPWEDIQLDRAAFWAALCTEELGDPQTANRIRLELGQNPWDNYYTMHSYLWMKTVLDTTVEMIKEFRRTPNPLVYYGEGLNHLMNDFEYAFRVRDFLGTKYALMILQRSKRKIRSREEWIALAEVYKKFAVYGAAYRVYDFINRKYYSDLSYVEKAFMLKERFPLYYDTIVEKYARRYGLEKELIMGLIKQESTFRAEALSRAKALGLMQLMPFTARDMASLAGIRLNSKNDLFDPETNIHLGSLYLKQLDRMFDGQKAFMLAAYNAGPHRVNRWRKNKGAEQLDMFIENIEYMETRTYVRHVLKNYWAYKLMNNNFEIEQSELLGFLNEAD